MPGSWADLFDLLARMFGGGEQARAAAVEWIRQAVEARYGVRSLRDLDRGRRAVAFQKACGTWIGLWESLEGDLAFYAGQRDLVRDVVARYWDGAVVDGPPWRVAPTEGMRPTYGEWVAAADFAEVVDAAPAA